MSELITGTFHFAQIHWLWLLFVIPLIWAIYILLYNHGKTVSKSVQNFADPHLLPHLMPEGVPKQDKNKTWLGLSLWSLVWLFGILAMAGPRWDYTEVEAFRPDEAIIVLLDLSRSMDADDVKPSRLARAKQEIEDLGKLSEGMSVGLVVFASVSHMITPLTHDRAALEQVLPSIKTDLIYTQGSRLVPALQMAAKMLETVKGDEKHILVISDGEFNDANGEIYNHQTRLKENGIKTHLMGIGTTSGAPVPDKNGGFIKKGNQMVISRLEEGRMKRIASDGNGIYLEASYLEDDTRKLLGLIDRSAEERKDEKKAIRFWKEHFYMFLVPCLLFCLPWFRRGAVFPALFLALTLLTVPNTAHAFDWRDWFMNDGQKGRKAMEEKQFDEAEEIFQDDEYRRGVVQYKAGEFDEAAKSFENVERDDVRQQAKYNYGNAKLMSGQLEDAIEAYKEVLEQNPEHMNAKYNMEIAKKLLEQQQKKQEQQQQQNQNQQQQEQQQSSDQQQQNSEQQQDSEQQESSDQQQQNSEQQQNENQQQQDSSDQSQSQDSNNQEQQDQQSSEQDQQQSTDGNRQQNDQDQKDQQDKNNKDQQKQDSAQSEQEKQEEQEQQEQNQSDQTNQEKEERREKEREQEQQQEQQQSSSGDEKEDEKEDEQQSRAQAEDKQESEEGEQEDKQEQQEAQAEEQQEQQEQREDGQQETEEQNAQATPDQENQEQHNPERHDQEEQAEQADQPRELPDLPDLPDIPEGDEPIPYNPDGPTKRSQKDVDADQWLNRIESDTELFLRNKFYIESQRKKAKEDEEAW